MFDRVNHEELFCKLYNKGFPKSLVRILSLWYAHQSMHIKWGNRVSAPLYVGNRVRQGSVWSPRMFNVYMDDLSKLLDDCVKGFDQWLLVVVVGVL